MAVTVTGLITPADSIPVEYAVQVGSVSGRTTSISPTLAGYVFASNGISANPSFQTLSSLGALISMNGNSGSATPSAGVITITTGALNVNGTSKFTGSGSTLTYSSSNGTDVGFGANCLVSSPNNNNSGFGVNCLTNVSGGFNAGYGTSALGNLVGGNYNTAIGYFAGAGYTTSESSNISINAGGTTGESNTLRIGGGTGTGNAQLNKAFISGIYGITASGADRTVIINSSNQLGTLTGTPIVQINGNTGSITPSSGVVTITTGTGNQNGTAIFSGSGSSLLFQASPGNDCGFGTNALAASSNANNTAFGSLAMPTASGGQNTGVGRGGLGNLTTGTYNTAIGYLAGGTYTTETSNICINAAGSASENNTLRIGAGTGTGNAQLNRAFVCGVQSQTITGTPIGVSSTDQIGKMATTGSGNIVLATAPTLTGQVSIANPSSSANLDAVTINVVGSSGGSGLKISNFGSGAGWAEILTPNDNAAQFTRFNNAAGAQTGYTTAVDASTWGVNFGIGQSTLSFYSSGTFTPSATFDTPGDVSVTYGARSGTYVRIGNMIVATVTLGFNATYTTASGNLQITGFPYAFSSNVQYGTGWINSNWPGSGTQMGSLTKASSSAINLWAGSNGVAASYFTTSQIASGISYSLYATITAAIV